MRSMGFDLAIAPLTCSHCCCKPHEAQFYSRTRQLLVATSDHAHGSIGNPRAARRSDQECEVRFIDARQREGPKVASEAGISLRTKWYQRRVHQCGIAVCSAGCVTSQRPFNHGHVVRCTNRIPAGQDEALHLELQSACGQVDIRTAACCRPWLTATGDLSGTRTYLITRLNDPDDLFPFHFEVIRLPEERGFCGATMGSPSAIDNSGLDANPHEDEDDEAGCVAPAVPKCFHCCFLLLKTLHFDSSFDDTDVVGSPSYTRRPAMNRFYSRRNLMATRLVLLHEISKA